MPPGLSVQPVLDAEAEHAQGGQQEKRDVMTVFHINVVFLLM